MNKKIHQELKILEKFINVYCHKKHSTDRADLCSKCRDLLEYATERLDKCPMDPKPKCKDCSIHCYREEYRSQIREVMKFSGIYFVKRGRLDWLLRYFLHNR